MFCICDFWCSNKSKLMDSVSQMSNFQCGHHYYLVAAVYITPNANSKYAQNYFLGVYVCLWFKDKKGFSFIKKIKRKTA